MIISGKLQVQGAQIGAQNLVPSGGIILWSGALSAVPAGWALCDGSHGTPDLRDRFVVGAGATSLAVGATGGAKTATLSVQNLPAHVHTGVTDPAGGHVHTGVTDTDGAHNHIQHLGNLDDKNLSSVQGQTPPADSGAGSTTYTIDATGSAHNHRFTTDAVPDHVHAFTTNATGSGTPFGVMPPFFALAFIMKL